MKKLIWVASFTSVLVGIGFFVTQKLFSHNFHITGTIGLDPNLESRAKRPNTVLFLIAKNHAGIPVAVKRIINPQFPLKFEIDSEDLVLPGGSWTGPLHVEVLVNNHGHAGVILPGDLTGSHSTLVATGSTPISITVDKVLNKPDPHS
ncbi:MAG: hypothetical protein HY399_00625 [Elusimicrobia bacterium]|nr:hypothetical protein [Elusimicrobiota bacterium]